MILWDVNVWIYSFRKESPKHRDARTVMQQTLRTPGEQFLFFPHIAVSFLRIVTINMIFHTPSSLQEAWTFINVLSHHPNARAADLDPALFAVFRHLTLIHEAAGNTVSDVLLAAAALQHDARLITADAGFLRYSEIRTTII